MNRAEKILSINEVTIIINIVVFIVHTKYYSFIYLVEFQRPKKISNFENFIII